MGLPCFLFFFFLLFPFASSSLYEPPPVDMVYHMGPVLTSPINLYVIWYGHWHPARRAIIGDFLRSISSLAPFPAVSDWWRTARLYTDQTGGNITASYSLAGEFHDGRYSHGRSLTRLEMQSVIRSAVGARRRRQPLDTRRGLYLVLTAPDVRVQDFCRAVCGFHYFTFPAVAGAVVPYAWVGHSGDQCPGMCAFPFAPPPFPGGGPAALRPPNGDAATDAMVSVIAHELAEASSNPLVNAWYAGGDPTAPTEIADLCMGVYGTGAGGGYVGDVQEDAEKRVYNVNGVNGRRFLVQWLWDPYRKRCFGPNAEN